MIVYPDREQCRRSGLEPWDAHYGLPLSSEFGTSKTVRTRVRSQLSDDHALVGPLWEGYHESKRCSIDTHPESYIIKYTSIRRIVLDCGLLARQRLTTFTVDLIRFERRGCGDPWKKTGCTPNQIQSLGLRGEGSGNRDYEVAGNLGSKRRPCERAFTVLRFPASG